MFAPLFVEAVNREVVVVLAGPVSESAPMGISQSKQQYTAQDEGPHPASCDAVDYVPEKFTSVEAILGKYAFSKTNDRYLTVTDKTLSKFNAAQQKDEQLRLGLHLAGCTQLDFSRNNFRIFDLKILVAPLVDSLTPDFLGGFSGLEVFVSKVASIVDSRLSILQTDLKTVPRLSFKACCIRYADLSNVEELQQSAFFDCKYLREVRATKARKLGKCCFSQCISLHRVECPVVEEVGEMCFKEAENLSYLLFPSVKSIDSCAFARSGLKQFVTRCEL